MLLTPPRRLSALRASPSTRATLRAVWSTQAICSATSTRCSPTCSVRSIRKLRGFYHLEGVSATVDHATARYIVRDHDAAKFQQKLDLIDAAASMLNQRLGEERVTVEIKQQYRNMGEIVCDFPELIDVAKEAYLACGVEPKYCRFAAAPTARSCRSAVCPAPTFPPAAIATTASTSLSRSARSSR